MNTYGAEFKRWLVILSQLPDPLVTDPSELTTQHVDLVPKQASSGALVTKSSLIKLINQNYYIYYYLFCEYYYLQEKEESIESTMMSWKRRLFEMGIWK